MSGHGAYVNRARSWLASGCSTLTSSGTGQKLTSQKEVHQEDIRIFIAEQAKRLSHWRALVLKLVSPELRSVHQSKDILQEAFLNALRSEGKFLGRSEAELILWFVGIIKNTIRDFARDYRRHTKKNVLFCTLEGKSSQGEKRDSEGVDKICPWSSPEEILSLRDEITKLFHTILSLPPDVELLLIFVDVENIPVALAAQKLGLTSKQASQRLWRGRRKLRECHAPEEAKEQ